MEQRDDACVVIVRGEIDLATHEHLGEKLREAIGSGSPVVVDLSRCEFIDSSGIRALLLGDREANNFAIASPTDQVNRVLEMTGVSQALPVHASVEQALKALA